MEQDHAVTDTEQTSLCGTLYHAIFLYSTHYLDNYVGTIY